MNRSHDSTRLDDAIAADELGIESGGYGIFRLRCRYQPIFQKRGANLEAAAVEGAVTPHLAGDIVPEELFLGAASDGDRDFIQQMGIALPVRNHRNLETGLGLGLLLPVAPAGMRAERQAERLALIGEEIAQAGLEAGLVHCCVNDVPISQTFPLSRLGEEIRRLGMRVAIGDFGAGRWTDEQIDALRPEIVRIDGGWFRQVCRDAVTIRLFEAVVARLHERRAKVLVGGIDSEQQLGVAVRGGAELFQGSHLAPHAHVGTALVETLSLKGKLGGTAKIVPLYG
jgi:EAL domain-containing protein (putative c-di-GMP-specific phosphodiesterase class I)